MKIIPETPHAHEIRYMIFLILPYPYHHSDKNAQMLRLSTEVKNTNQQQARGRFMLI